MMPIQTIGTVSSTTKAEKAYIIHATGNASHAESMRNSRASGKFNLIGPYLWKNLRNRAHFDKFRIIWAPFYDFCSNFGKGPEGNLPTLKRSTIYSISSNFIQHVVLSTVYFFSANSSVCHWLSPCNNRKLKESLVYSVWRSGLKFWSLWKLRSDPGSECDN